MNIQFKRASRGLAWERWAIMEDQLGDSAFAGEVILTYGDPGACSDVQCDLILVRDLTDEEVEEAFQEVSSILSGQGNVNVFSAKRIESRGFSLLDDD
ncbi:MAG: hypothetical protein ACYC2Y_09550 [Armatimonadota bacterium]